VRKYNKDADAVDESAAPAAATNGDVSMVDGDSSDEEELITETKLNGVSETEKVKSHEKQEKQAKKDEKAKRKLEKAEKKAKKAAKEEGGDGKKRKRDDDGEKKKSKKSKA